MAVEYEVADRRVPVGGSTKVTFRLTDPATSLPKSDIPDVQVMYYRSDGRGRTVVPAKPLGDGRYEAEVTVSEMATWYVFVGAPSEELSYSELPFLSLMGVPPRAAEVGN
jgi:hypothetical protein